MCQMNFRYFDKRERYRVNIQVTARATDINHRRIFIRMVRESCLHHPCAYLYPVLSGTTMGWLGTGYWRVT